MDKEPALLERVALDLVALIFTATPGVAAWTVFAWGAIALEGPARLAWLVAAPLTLLTVFIGTEFALRLTLPKLKRGSHPLGFNKGVVTWYCHLALNRASPVSGLRYLINAFYVTKYLHLRALGAKIAFGLGTSLDFVCVDLPLIEIGRNCFLGQNIHLSCHTINGGKLHLLPVKIGSGVFVGMDCLIGPGSRIGDGCRIGFGSKVYGDRIAPGTLIEDGAWIYGNPARKKVIQQQEKNHESA